jgi:WD40 repeat protein
MSLEKVKLSEDHKLLDFRWNDLEMVTTLFSCDQLRKVWTWKHPILALSEIEREDTIFLGNQRLAFLVWHKSQRMSCTLSVWDLQPQVQEVGRFPLVGLEVVPRWPSTYGSYLVIVGTDASFSKSEIAPTYLIVYDVRQRTVISKYELGKFKWNREDLLAPEPVSIIGYSPQKNRTVLYVNETIHLYEHGKPVQVIEAPKDNSNRQMYADELSPDGRYIAFSSGRVVGLYDVDKGDHTILDKTLEEIHQRWENPPPFSKLAHVVRHPMMRPLMPLMKKLLRWTHLEFTQDGRYLLGITNYGLVVLWDVEQKKRIKSFPIMQGFGTEMNEILGLR